jgi:hypothetical protein
MMARTMRLSPERVNTLTFVSTGEPLRPHPVEELLRCFHSAVPAHDQYGARISRDHFAQGSDQRRIRVHVQQNVARDDGVDLREDPGSVSPIIVVIPRITLASSHLNGGSPTAPPRVRHVMGTTAAAIEPVESIVEAQVPRHEIIVVAHVARYDFITTERRRRRSNINRRQRRIIVQLAVHRRVQGQPNGKQTCRRP